MLDKKTPAEIEILKQGGAKLAQILNKLASQVKPGITGQELNKIAEELIFKAGGTPSFKGYHGFPAALCVSVNQTVVHGIPNPKPFQEGDLVGLDIGMKYKGLYTDMATTVPVGQTSGAVQKFLDTAKKALEIGIQEVGPDKYINDIGAAIEKYIRARNFGIVRTLSGHGVGRSIHEEPTVPNFDSGHKIAKMFEGLVIAIEPMIIMGGNDDVVIAQNHWDVDSKDRSLTAHFEHTVAVTENGYLIITK